MLIYIKIRHQGLSSPELAPEKEERKKIENLLHFEISGLDIYNYLYGCSWDCWIGNLL